MKTMQIQLEDSIAEKFEIALKLSGKDANVVLTELLRGYVADTFAAAADSLQDGNARRNTADCPSPPPRTARRAVPPPMQGRPLHRQPRQEREMPWDNWGKAIQRIPRWARNPQQYNHKILRAFFELQQELGRVTLDALRGRCSDPAGHPETYVPHFDNNYTQMKFDNGNSHGKVFEERDGFITLWDRINDTLMRYRDYFT